MIKSSTVLLIVSAILFTGCGPKRTVVQVEYTDGGTEYKKFESEKKVFIKTDKTTFDLAEKIVVNSQVTDDVKSASYIVTIKHNNCKISDVSTNVTSDGATSAKMYYYRVTGMMDIDVSTVDGKNIDNIESGGDMVLTIGNKYVNNSLRGGDIYQINNSNTPLFISGANYDRFLENNKEEIPKAVIAMARDRRFSECLRRFNEKYFYGKKDAHFYILEGGNSDYLAKSFENFKTLKNNDDYNAALKTYTDLYKNGVKDEDRLIAVNNAGVLCVKLKKITEAAVYFDEAAAMKVSDADVGKLNAEKLKEIQGKL